MPKITVIAKPSTTGPPRKYSENNAMKVVMPVMMVRDSVLLTALLMVSSGPSLRALRKISRTRSNTTTLSLIE